MSIASYRKNEKLKVTGPRLPTCFPAALEQISPDHRLPPKVYKDYREYINNISILPKSKRHLLIEEDLELYSNVLKHLGNLTSDDLIFKRANSAIGLKRIIHKLIDDGCRVTVDIDQRGWKTVHTVGLMPTSELDYFTLVSNYIPNNLQGIISLDKIAARLAISSEAHLSKNPYYDANITALPPAA